MRFDGFILAAFVAGFCVPDAAAARTWRSNTAVAGHENDTARSVSDRQTPSPFVTISKSIHEPAVRDNEGAHVDLTMLSRSANTTSTNNDSESDNNQLPIEPTLTPALGVAGVVLVVTGLAYAFFGIRYEWLLASLGTGYIVAIGVTVLIIHLIDPPISNAIQGAYTVAVVMGATIAGALAILFPKITTGFGCISGGFCFAMWLLVMKSGGLVTSTIGKALMIALLSVAPWPFWLLKTTQHYALIGSASFTGATAMTLGIDCFSRAGLKEFWVYIWNGNNHEFLPNTTNYPATLGIRVETACILVLFVLGCACQWRLRSIVNEQKSQANRRQHQHQTTYHMRRDSPEGTIFEERHKLSLANWEAVYGDKAGAIVHVESGLGSSQETLRVSFADLSLTEAVDTVEMDDLDTSGVRRIVTAVDSVDERARRNSMRRDSKTIYREVKMNGSPDNASTSKLVPSTSVSEIGCISKDGSTTATVEEVSLEEHDEEELLRTAPPPITTIPNIDDRKKENVDFDADDSEPEITEWRRSTPRVGNAYRSNRWTRDGSTLLQERGDADITYRPTDHNQRGQQITNARRHFSTPSLSIQRQRSRRTAYLSKRSTQCTSTPLVGQSLIGSSIEEERGEDFNPGATLLNERGVRIQRQPRSVNFNAASTSWNAPQRVSSPVSAQMTDLEDSEMTLSQRKALLHQGRIRTTSDTSSIKSSRSRSSLSSAAPYTTSTTSIYSSPSIIVPSPATILSQWHESLAQPNHQPSLLAEQCSDFSPYAAAQYHPAVYRSPAPSVQSQYAQHARQTMAEQLRYRDYQERVQRLERRKWESMEEMAMRTGLMTDRHRRALGKMQEEANRSLG